MVLTRAETRLHQHHRGMEWASFWRICCSLPSWFYSDSKTRITGLCLNRVRLLSISFPGTCQT